MAGHPAGQRSPDVDDVLFRPRMVDGLRLTWRLFRDPRVAPRLKQVVALLGALYVLSPVDLIPDPLVGPGQVDDLGVMGLVVFVLARVVPRLAPRAIVEEHLAAMGLSRRHADAGPDSRR